MLEGFTHDRPFQGSKIKREYLDKYNISCIYLFNKGSIVDLSNQNNIGEYVNPGVLRREYLSSINKKVSIPPNVDLYKEPFSMIFRIHLKSVFISGLTETIYEVKDKDSQNLLKLRYNFNSQNFEVYINDLNALSSGSLVTYWQGSWNREFLISFIYNGENYFWFFNDAFRRDGFISFAEIRTDPEATIEISVDSENIDIEEFIFCKNALSHYDIAKIYREPYHYLEY